MNRPSIRVHAKIEFSPQNATQKKAKKRGMLHRQKKMLQTRIPLKPDQSQTSIQKSFFKTEIPAESPKCIDKTTIQPGRFF